MIIKPRSIFQIATAAGREYVTPEDVTDSLKSGYGRERVRRDVLKAIGGVCGVEDASLAAWIAWRWRGK